MHVATLWSSGLAWRDPRVLALVVGALVALVLFAVLRKRFLTRDAGSLGAEAPVLDALPLGSRVAWSKDVVARSFRNSVAFLSAAGATALAWASFFATRGSSWAPWIAALPIGLGAYAVTATLIDAVATRRLGVQRVHVLLLALIAIAGPALVLEALIALVTGALLLGLLVAFFLH